jgi:hypothetical protein
MNGDSLWSVSLLLSSVFEGTNELWHIVIIGLGILLSGSEISELRLQEIVLLWSDLLKDIWHHVLEQLGFWVSGHDEKVLSNGELG